MSISFKRSVSLILFAVMLFAMLFVLNGCISKNENYQVTDASVTETAVHICKFF